LYFTRDIVLGSRFAVVLDLCSVDRVISRTSVLGSEQRVDLDVIAVFVHEAEVVISRSSLLQFAAQEETTNTEGSQSTSTRDGEGDGQVLVIVIGDDGGRRNDSDFDLVSVGQTRSTTEIGGSTVVQVINSDDDVVNASNVGSEGQRGQEVVELVLSSLAGEDGVVFVPRAGTLEGTLVGQGEGTSGTRFKLKSDQQVEISGIRISDGGLDDGQSVALNYSVRTTNSDDRRSVNRGNVDGDKGVGGASTVRIFNGEGDGGVVTARRASSGNEENFEIARGSGRDDVVSFSDLSSLSTVDDAEQVTTLRQVSNNANQSFGGIINIRAREGQLERSVSRGAFTVGKVGYDDWRIVDGDDVDGDVVGSLDLGVTVSQDVREGGVRRSRILSSRDKLGELGVSRDGRSTRDGSRAASRLRSAEVESTVARVDGRDNTGQSVAISGSEAISGGQGDQTNRVFVDVNSLGTTIAVGDNVDGCGVGSFREQAIRVTNLEVELSEDIAVNRNAVSRRHVVEGTIASGDETCGDGRSHSSVGVQSSLEGRRNIDNSDDGSATLALEGNRGGGVLLSGDGLVLRGRRSLESVDNQGNSVGTRLGVHFVLSLEGHSGKGRTVGDGELTSRRIVGEAIRS
jgi:hypothetical protein